MGWKHYQTVEPPKREPQVGSGLFGVLLLILHSKFQFSKSIPQFKVAEHSFQVPISNSP